MKKCDKKDLTQSQSKLQTMINTASATDLGTKVVSLNSEIQQKTSELRQEMIRKFSELSSQFTDQLVKKASVEEVRILNEEKIDLSQVK